MSGILFQEAGTPKDHLTFFSQIHHFFLLTNGIQRGIPIKKVGLAKMDMFIFCSLHCSQNRACLDQLVQNLQALRGLKEVMGSSLPSRVCGVAGVACICPCHCSEWCSSCLLASYMSASRENQSKAYHNSFQC